MGPTARELVAEEERRGGVGRTLFDGIEYDGHPGGARRGAANLSQPVPHKH